MSKDNASAPQIVNLKKVEFKTDTPHHEVQFPLDAEDQFYTIRTNFGKLQLVLMTAAALQVGEFASKEDSNLGTLVKNAQIVFKGHVVKNWQMQGFPLAHEELNAFNAALIAEKPFVPELSDEQFLMNVECRYEKGTKSQRKGEMTLEEWIPTDSLVRNKVVADGKTVDKEDGYCTGPVRDVAKQILRWVREGLDPQWIQIMKSHDSGGYVRIQDFTSKASESENESVKDQLNAAEKGEKAGGESTDNKEGDI